MYRSSKSWFFVWPFYLVTWHDLDLYLLWSLGWSLFSKFGISWLPTRGFVRFREEIHWVKLFTNRFIFTRCSMTFKFHEMPYNDVKGSIYVFAYYFRLDEDRDMGEVPKYSHCIGRSNDMQHDLLREPRDLDLDLTWGQIWHQVKFDVWRSSYTSPKVG